MTYPEWEEISGGHRIKGRDLPMLAPDTPTFMGLPHARGRGLAGMSFICIAPGSAVIYRTIVYMILFLLGGRTLAKLQGT